MVYQLNRPDIDTVVDYIQNLMEEDKIEYNKLISK